MRLALHACWVFFSRIGVIAGLLWRAVRGPEPMQARARTVAHTWLGAYLAAALWKQQIAHIHIHHGYFSSWAGMVAARIFRRDIQPDPARFRSSGPCGLPRLQTEALLSFCLTVSEFNGRYIRVTLSICSSSKVLVSILEKSIYVLEP